MLGRVGMLAGPGLSGWYHLRACGRLVVLMRATLKDGTVGCSEANKPIRAGRGSANRLNA
ncbi:MAG: hypothetical protein HOL51_21460 [Gemmatimonadetes bacterium]|nr:hypothetical protein [Gemmatimonadota bacterium]MBT5328687.1 hypothetical protein [Gemmatimonadota bacterium]MBT5801240.1 hypothetical protein [Gemmatimonadota bacterium]MBT7588018.1 hypothetical protein [Gemmatimonadota bacterium]